MGRGTHQPPVSGADASKRNPRGTTSATHQRRAIAKNEKNRPPGDDSCTHHALLVLFSNSFSAAAATKRVAARLQHLAAARVDEARRAPLQRCKLAGQGRAARMHVSNETLAFARRHVKLIEQAGEPPMWASRSSTHQGSTSG